MLPSRLFYDSFFPEFDMKGMNSDVYVKDGSYHIEIDVPGFRKEDIKIEINKGTITVKAEKEVKEENDGKEYIRHERKYNKLERSYSFSDIDEENITAEFKDGTLHLVLPRKQEEIKRQIIID